MQRNPLFTGNDAFLFIIQLKGFTMRENSSGLENSIYSLFC